jgi:hypothetical protein
MRYSEGIPRRENMYVLMGCMRAARTLQWRDTKSGNILKYYNFLWAAHLLQWRDTKSGNILKYYIFFWAARALQWRDTRVLWAKLVSKTSKRSKHKRGSVKWELRNFDKIWKIVSGVKCHPRLLGRQMPPRCYWGVKCHQRLLGRQTPLEVIGASNATQGLLGRQMPPGVLGRQMPHWDYRGVKGHTGVKRPASRFMRSQRLGRQRSGASGIRWGGQGSKFGRQGSGRQRSRASSWGFGVCYCLGNVLGLRLRWLFSSHSSMKGVTLCN